MDLFVRGRKVRWKHEDVGSASDCFSVNPTGIGCHGLKRRGKGNSKTKLQMRRRCTFRCLQDAKQHHEKMNRRKLADKLESLASGIADLSIQSCHQFLAKEPVLHKHLAKEIHDFSCGLEPEVDSDFICRMESEIDTNLDSELESEVDTNLDSELESEVDTNLDSELESEVDLDEDLESDWDNHVVSWEELKAKALHIVRMHEVTEYDPVHCVPVCTRFCKYNLAYFDFDKESKVLCGKPFLELMPSEHSMLEESVNVISLRILESDMGYPIRVFGTVLVRDQVDYKCVYLFRRDKDDAQVINSPEDSLTLTDPCRGLAVTSSMFFEINLKIKGDAGDVITFNKGVIEHDTCISKGEKLMEYIIASWHSKVKLAYTPVPYAVTATLSVSMLQGPCEFTGEVIAWTSKNENKIILHDSKVAGTSTELGAGGSVALSRCLVAVPVDENLMLRICVRDGAAEAECLEFTLGHLLDSRTCFLDSCKLQVDVEWTGILSTMREDVYERVGYTRLLLRKFCNGSLGCSKLLMEHL